VDATGGHLLGSIPVGVACNRADLPGMQIAVANEALIQRARASAGGQQKATYSSVDELAKELGICRVIAYAALKRGDIPSIRIGKRYIIPRTAIAEWLKSAGKSLNNAQ
jgi:excisionase family DNA binding protein